MILVDTNVFMYAAGAPHEHKEASRALTVAIARGVVDAAIDAEVLQEILHRYRAIDRWAEGRQVFDLTRRIVPVVVPVTVDMMDRARRMMDLVPSLSARDAVHAAACVESGAEAICSYDRAFDGIAEVRRVVPDDVSRRP